MTTQPKEATLQELELELELVVRFYVSDKELRQELISDLKHLIEKAERKARLEAKQEFRDKFHIDPTKKYHVIGTEKAIIITEWEHHKTLTALNDMQPSDSDSSQSQADAS